MRDDILVAVVLATNNDVAVRMPGVEMISRDPVDLGAEVFLHLRHETSGQLHEVIVLDAVFRRRM
ncbi:hypothetical protein [Mesorhizobium sp.]|uniref:hypothetical protein n=1 Tax=Mesorhizobium sp. TaxID=1871066 RepID=UPI002579A177|nr:hypothetical protein [Mesorhizobium sp.]